jgi:hypothetical protein
VQTRTRNALVFGAAAAAAAAGLFAIERSRRPLDLSPKVLDAVPAGALLVATADLEALRASPTGAGALLLKDREIPGLGKVRDVCGFDPLDTLTEAAIAIPATGDAGEFGLVATGPVDAEALLACASKVIDARGGRAVTSTLGSFRAVRDASLTSTAGEIAVRRGGPLLLGAGPYLLAMIDAADGRAPTIRSSAAHTFLARAVGGGQIRVTAVLSPEQRRVVADELESGGAGGATIQAAALGVTLGPNIGLHAVLSCDASCGSVARRLAEVRDARAQDRGVFAAILQGLRIDPEGELVHARVDIPAEQAITLVSRLLALRGHRSLPPDHPPLPGPSAAPPPAPDEILKPDAGRR